MAREKPRWAHEKVLVATDFSPGAEHALERALLLPLSPTATIHMLHVLPIGMPPKIRERVEKNARNQLDRIASGASKSLAAEGKTRRLLKPKVVVGQPYLEIIRHARASAVDLVIIGRHGKRGIRDLFVGSTAIRVIRKGDFPVLVVSRKPNQPYRRPLIAVDLADTARAILELAAKVLQPGVTTIHVVHAYDVPFRGFVGTAFTRKELHEYRREFREKAESGLRKILRASTDGGTQWTGFVRQGDARSVVLRETARRRSDLIVLGTHARSGVSRVLLGSVAEWVISAAHCDTLVARPAHFSFHLP